MFSRLYLILIALVVLTALSFEALADDNNLSQAQKEFREKYRIEERGRIQMQGFNVPDLNTSGESRQELERAIEIKRFNRLDRSNDYRSEQSNQSSTDMKLSDLQRVKDINLTAFEQNELNVSKLKQDMNKTDKNAEAVSLFFGSIDAQKKIDEQTRFILKDEAFGAYEYAGEYKDIIDDQLKDPNNPVFSSSQRNNNNRYLNANEQVIVVISSSIPKSTLRAYFQDIDAIEAPLDVKFVLRGVIGNPETLMPTMEYMASIVRKDDKDPFSFKEAVKKRMDNNETIETYNVKIDINPKITRKYQIDRVPAVIYVRNYNPAIEQPKSLNEAINASDREAFYIAYGASRLDYSLSKINEKAKSEGLKRLINALQHQGFFGIRDETNKSKQGD